MVGANPQIADTVREWITENHIPLPKPGEPEPTLMEEMAQREEAQRAVSGAEWKVSTGSLTLPGGDRTG